MLLLLFALPAARLDPAHPSEAALLTQLQALQPEPELERRANYEHFDAQLEAALERANKIECNVVLDSEPVSSQIKTVYKKMLAEQKATLKKLKAVLVLRKKELAEQEVILLSLERSLERAELKQLERDIDRLETSTMA